MWDDVIIGSGEHLCSSTIRWNGKDKVENPCSVSENSNSYWISVPDIFGGGMKIYKNTRQAVELAELLVNKSDQAINDYILKIYLGYIDPVKIIAMINRSYLKGHSEGMSMKQQQIREVLGIEEW